MPISFYNWRAGASQPSRPAGSDFSIGIYNGRCTYRNSDNTRIKLQYPYTLDYNIHLYSALETDNEGRCVSLQKAQRKRHDYPDAEVARRDRARRAAQSSQATKNCRGSETAEARERRGRDRRKRRLDSESATHDACIAENVSSYIS